MANQYDDFDTEDDENETQGDNAPAGLRKALKREQREKQKLADELAEVRKWQRERSLKDVLDAEGVNAKIAGLIPPNVTTPDEVKAWLFEYGDVFGAKPAVATVVENDPEVESLARINQSINSAQAAPSKMEDLRNAVAGAKTRADLDALTGNLVADGRRN